MQPATEREGGAPSPAIKQHVFTKEDLNGQTVNFQVLDIGKQLYVWVSTSTDMLNLALAVPGRQSMPASTQLLPGKGADAAQGVARRLTLKCGQPVAVSWNVEGEELLGVWAEKQLIEELRNLELVCKA